MLAQDLRAILRFVSRYVRERGYAPSYAEIAEAVPLPSVAHVQYRIEKLETLGYISRVPKRARSLRVLRLPPEDALAGRWSGFAARFRRRLIAFWRGIRTWIRAKWGAAALFLRRCRRRLAGLAG